MALDLTIIKPDNLLATGPTASNTAVPSKVTKVDGEDIWEYEFTNSWPQPGTWVVTLNADGFSIAKGTVLGSFTVTQGTYYKLAVNWNATTTISELRTKVTAVEETTADLATSVNNVGTVNAGLDRRLGIVETSVTNAGTRLDAIEEAQLLGDLTVGDHTTQIEALAQRIAALEAQLNP
jgi:hypothetical protein